MWEIRRGGSGVDFFISFDISLWIKTTALSKTLTNSSRYNYLTTLTIPPDLRAYQA